MKPAFLGKDDTPSTLASLDMADLQTAFHRNHNAITSRGGYMADTETKIIALEQQLFCIFSLLTRALQGRDI